MKARVTVVAQRLKQHHDSGQYDTMYATIAKMAGVCFLLAWAAVQVRDTLSAATSCGSPFTFKPLPPLLQSSTD
jgi:hypothetical protein